jgi:hypothetical protein
LELFVSRRVPALSIGKLIILTLRELKLDTGCSCRKNLKPDAAFAVHGQRAVSGLDQRCGGCDGAGGASLETCFELVSATTLGGK